MSQKFEIEPCNQQSFETTLHVHAIVNWFLKVGNYCLLSADIELALNVSTYAGQRSPQLVMTHNDITNLHYVMH